MQTPVHDNYPLESLLRMAMEGSETQDRERARTVRNIATLICLLSLPMFAQIPNTGKLPIRSLHTHDGGLFVRLASEVIPPSVFKIGNGVSPPRPIFTPDPEYTQEARREKCRGTVVLGVIVETDGCPYGIKVLRSQKYGLDESAIAAVQKWRFQPALKDGKPVAVYISVEVNFLWPGQ